MKRFVNRLKKHLTSGKALYRYIEKAASVLGEERECTKSNMSSTIVALVTDGEKAVWAHSGDSVFTTYQKREFRRLRTTILSHSEILKRG